MCHIPEPSQCDTRPLPVSPRTRPESRHDRTVSAVASTATIAVVWAFRNLKALKDEQKFDPHLHFASESPLLNHS